MKWCRSGEQLTSTVNASVKTQTPQIYAQEFFWNRFLLITKSNRICFVFTTSKFNESRTCLAAFSLTPSKANLTFQSFLRLIIINRISTASLKSLGDKASGLFERKKKEAGDIAGEKATTAKKLAEDQVKKTTDAISGATSGAQGLIGGITDDAKSGAKDVQKKAGEIQVHSSSSTSLKLFSI